MGSLDGRTEEEVWAWASESGAAFLIGGLSGRFSFSLAQSYLDSGRLDWASN
jgi:hypothetical protein